MGYTGAPDPPRRYVVALAGDVNSLRENAAQCPLSEQALETLLRVRPELRIDRRRPDAAELARRLAAFWLPDEVILYIGLAGTSVQSRATAYYRTPLGARSPHAGGWFLKTLSVLPQLHVHYAPADDPADSEDHMLAAFSAGVSDAARASLHDPDRPIPFANLEWPKHRYKRHGITGAKQPRAPRPARDVPPPPTGAPLQSGASDGRSQRVTAADLAAGRIRIPRGTTKALFPDGRQEITLDLRGQRFGCRWDPRMGPDRERSGVLTVGRARLEDLVAANEVLAVERRDGILQLQ